MGKREVEVEGYVCNNRMCGQRGNAFYFKYFPKLEKECPRCGSERTELVVSTKEEVNDGTKMATPMLGNSSMKGKAYYQSRSDKR